MERLLVRVFTEAVRSGSLSVVAASGRHFRFGDGTGKPVAIRFATSAWQTAVLLDPELRLGEAYMEQGLLVEEGSLADLLDLLTRNLSTSHPPSWARWLRGLRSVLRATFQTNGIRASVRNARYHYNISYHIYKLFLDNDLQYSCGYFEHDNSTLDEAQLAKKRHVARKLYLNRPGLRVLELGSGWGGLAMYLARTSGASVLAINLSDEQVKMARLRAAAESLSCEFKIDDYRNLSGEFDRIVSVGMLEHVGKQYYKTIFKKCFDLLKEDGVMVLHTVGRWDGPSDTNAWVWRYVFPGGYAPALSELAPAIEKSGLIIADVEVLRLHYAETLRHWRMRFLSHKKEILRLTDERFIRMWEYYLAGFEACFRHYGLVVFQLQLVKSIDSLPLIRDYIYEDAVVEKPRRTAGQIFALSKNSQILSC